LLLLLLLLLFRLEAKGCVGGGVGSHDCWEESVVNDVKSIVVEVLRGELELREAMLKFRGS
jgi:hypothetical protein